MKHTLVNIPDPNNPGSRILGIRIDENHEAWGDYGLTEPLDWLTKQLESKVVCPRCEHKGKYGITGLCPRCGKLAAGPVQNKQPEYSLYGYATPSGKLYASSLEALQNGEQSWVKVYVNKEDLK